MPKPKVLVIGAGPAGLLAAGAAASSGAEAVLLEKGPRISRKLLITGKGRCNLTNSASVSEFVEAFGSGGKFLHGAFSRFFNTDIISLLAENSVEVKEERGGRIFPVSDRAQDVADALEHWAVDCGSKIRTGFKAVSIVREANRVSRVKIAGGDMRADAVIIATGGMSYPKTGSTGDGYKMASELGHGITALRPALAPLLSSDSWKSRVMGLSLKNVLVTLMPKSGDRPKAAASEFGEMLFTHFGVSGPVILTLSGMVPDLLESGGCYLSIDLKPALSEEQLHQRLIRDFKQTLHLSNYMKTLLPNLLAQLFLELLSLDQNKPVNKITAAERKAIVELLKDFRVNIRAMAPLEEAIVTAGGVSLGEVDARTMMSKLVKGLFFAGEVLDLDARTGGYNLQAAFSTGFVAGKSAAEYAAGEIAGLDQN